MPLPTAAHGEPKLVVPYSFVHALRGRTEAAMTEGRIRRRKPPHLRIIWTIFKRPARATGAPCVEVDTRSTFILKLNGQMTDMISSARIQLHHDAGRTEDDATSPQCEFVAVLSQGGHFAECDPHRNLQ